MGIHAAARSSELTITDMFCGAGGSSIGAEAAGGRLAMAANHWQLAVDVHNANFPNAAHDCADVSQVAPRRYPHTDILVSSPSCTNHTLAKGTNRAAHRGQMSFDGLGPEEPAEAERSRATMWDVPRFAEYHDYRLIVVENVVDARDWVMYDAWLMAMTSLGYEHRELYLNSMFAGMGDWAAPQSRDRMYVVFWKKGNHAPQLDLHPEAWCFECEEVVAAVQSWKNPMHPWGKYRSQYVYVCPRCAKQVAPYAYAAARAIDWSITGQRIGDRTKPLVAATMARIEQGIAKYWGKGGIVVGLDRLREFKLPLPIDRPLTTQTARQDKALVETPFFAELRGQSKTKSVREPMGCLTAGGGHHGLVESPFVAEMRGTSSARDVHSPLGAVTAGGNHHGLVEPPLYIKQYGSVEKAGPMAHKVSDPLGSVTTQDHHALLQPPLVVTNNWGNRARPASDEPLPTCTTAGTTGLLVPTGGTWRSEAQALESPMATRTATESDGVLAPPLQATMSYYRTGHLRPVDEPVGAMTTRDRHALVEAPTPEIEDCTFRMLEPHEIGAAMAFPETYLVDGNKRQKVRLYGNAVTPPTMAWILGRAIASLEEAA